MLMVDLPHTPFDTENAAPASKCSLTLFPGLVEPKYVLDYVESGFNTPSRGIVRDDLYSR
jgi:hypothetical protein